MVELDVVSGSARKVDDWPTSVVDIGLRRYTADGWELIRVISNMFYMEVMGSKLTFVTVQPRLISQ